MHAEASPLLKVPDEADDPSATGGGEVVAATPHEDLV
jgi:hypothetical protein